MRVTKKGSEMGGLAVILFVALYVTVTYWLFVWLGGSNFRWLVLALALLIPSADAVVGRLYLKHLCAEEGGLKVHRVVEHVGGFMDDGSHSDYWIKEHGYQFAEDEPMNGMTTRYSLQNGEIVRENKVALSQSQYRVRSKRMGSLRDRYLRSVFLVEGISNGEVLATDTQIAFNGGWAERFIALFSDAGGGTVAWCTNTELDSMVRHRRIVTSTLKH